MSLPGLYQKKDAYYLAAAVFILITLPLLVYLVSAPQLIGKRAAVPTGTIVAQISPTDGQFSQNDSIDVTLSIAPKTAGSTVSLLGFSLRVFYEYTETTAPLTLVGSVQPIGWSCVRSGVYESAGRYGAEVVCVYTGGGDYPLSQSLPVARFTLKVNVIPQRNPVVLKFDEEWSQITDSSMTADILYAPTPQASYLIVGFGSIGGAVRRQIFTGRSGISVTLENGQQTYTDVSGRFTFNNVPYGTHTVSADYPRFLKRANDVSLSSPTPLDVGETMLLAGDQDDNGTIDIRDLVTVAVSFGQAVSANHQADVNGDGKVNIFDLVAVAVNWRKSEPVAW
jgi:hypothetical protein